MSTVTWEERNETTTVASQLPQAKKDTKNALIAAYNLRPPQRLLNQGLNENWFSDTLAWLLDVRSEHGLGVRFANGLLREIGQRRVKPECGLERRAEFLRVGKGGKGQLASDFNLQNSVVFRELSLQQPQHSAKKKSGRPLDLVFADLDAADSLVVCIENKLFGENSPGQLRDYYRLGEARHPQAKVREYVYLTLKGDKPRPHAETAKAKAKVQMGRGRRRSVETWVQLSWLTDIPQILKAAEKARTSKRPDPAVAELRDLLRWLGAVISPPKGSGFTLAGLGSLRALVLTACGRCLVAELNRLCRKDGGRWSIKKHWAKQTLRIMHTSTSKSSVVLKLEPGLRLSLHSHRSGRPRSSNLSVPLASHPDQIINLLDLAARDVYDIHFGEKGRTLYLRRHARRTSSRSEAHQDAQALFEHLHLYRYELKVALAHPRLLGLESEKPDQEEDI